MYTHPQAYTLYVASVIQIASLLTKVNIIIVFLANLNIKK